MFQHQAKPHPHHTMRFYIVMITLIVVGIFLVLVMNGNTDLTSAAVFGAEEKSNDYFVINSDFEDTETVAKKVKETVSKDSAKETKKSNGNEIPFSLTFSQIPFKIDRQVTVDDMTLGFTDEKATIKVNGDRLELSKQDAIPLKVVDFKGKMTFEGGIISLDGEAKRLEVNNVALSSDGKIELFIDELHYQTLGISNIALSSLELKDGNGEVVVESKLTYSLQGEQVDVEDFDGSLDIDRSAELPLSLSGMVGSISVSGSELNWDLR